MKFETCVDEYANAPEGVPTWCVEADVSWMSALQLIGELLLLIMLGYAAHRFSRWWKTRRLIAEQREEALNRKWP